MRTVKRHEEKFDSSNPHIDSYISDQLNKYRATPTSLRPEVSYPHPFLYPQQETRGNNSGATLRHATEIRPTLQRGKLHQEQKPVNDLVEIVSGGCLIGHWNILIIISLESFNAPAQWTHQKPYIIYYYFLNIWSSIGNQQKGKVKDQ